MPISSVFQVVSEDPEQIESLVTTLNGYVTTTAASEAAAATSETNAAVSETNAAASAAAALVSKNQAASSAASANSDASAASSSATTAQTAATSSSANAALTSADATQTAADRVQTGLDRVATNSDAVQTAADRVQTGLDVTSSSASAAAALSSRNAAGTSETNAAASAASSSADATATAADRVQTGLDRTATNADAIATAADRVQTGLDATASANSASAASTSATAAAASQVSAASSAASAAAVFNDFEDRYYGPHASDSAAQTHVTGLGLTVDQGDLYFNSTANEMRVYDGGSWIAASSAGGASLINYNYTATASQTAFTGADDNSNTLSYTVDNLIVTRNGVVLEDGTDYTATDGSTITLAVAATANDEINVVAFKSFTTADMVSATNGGAFQGNVDFAAGIDVTGNVTVTGTVDGRDVATDGTKLDGIEAGADVTDATNVAAAGAAMLTGANFTGNVDVTGTVTADGLIVQGNSGTSSSVVFGYNENGGEITLHDETGAVATLFDQAANNTRLLELVNGSDLVLGLGGSNTTGNIIFNSAGYSPAMTVDSSGSVGIGASTIAANTKLHVKAGTNLNFEVENASSTLRLSALNDARSANIPMQFASSQFEFLTGNVGIGGSPIAQSKLTVAGHSLSITGSDQNFGAGGVRGMLDLAGGYLRMGAVNGGGSASGVKLLAPAGQESVIVDTSGRVTMPYQPGMNVAAASGNSGAYNSSTNGAEFCIWTAVRYNIGNHYNTSNGIFTCPVAGKYLVSFHANWSSSGAGTWMMQQLYLNGSVYEQWYASTYGAWMNEQGATVVDCAAGDTIRLYKQTQSGSSGGADVNQYSSFVVQLLG